MLIIRIIELEPGWRYIEVHRGQAGQRVIMQLGYRDKGHIQQLQMPGKKRTEVREYLKGNSIEIGTVLG